MYLFTCKIPIKFWETKMAKSAKMLYSLDNSHVASLPGEKKKNWSVIRKSLENLIFGTPVGVEVQI